MTDCLIVGFNDYDLGKFIDMVRAMGRDSGAFKDLDLAFIEYDGRPYRALDVMTRFYYENKSEPVQPFHNVDFLWPTITYLGSYLHRRGFSFDYINLFHREKEQFREKLRKNDILTIAITTTLYVSPEPILEIIEFIRQHNTTAKIIIGGPYIGNQTIEAEEAAIQSLYRLVGADIYVDSNEGEFALVNILKTLKSGGSLEGLANVAYRRGDSYVINPESVESNPLEENPVNYRLFPVRELGEFVSLRTAKSCPFSCAFCGFPQRAGKYKYLPVELVEKELNTLADLGVGTITFLDDTFNVPKPRFKELLRMMIRNNYGFKWNSFYRSDHGDEEAIELMGRAGCEGVFLGVESGCDRVLEKMNKTARTKDYRKAIPLLKQAGVFTHASLVIGFPGETPETFQETMDFIEEVQPDSFRAQLWYADPVTPVWKKKDELEIKGSAFHWSHHTMDFQTACYLVDKMFLSVRNSVWLPQNGFELWSVFYLKRRGMTVEQVKAFLRAFNAGIREKLVYPGKADLSPALAEQLKQTCRYDEPAQTTPPELYSAGEYVAAREFWTGQFRSEAPLCNVPTATGSTGERNQGWGEIGCELRPETLTALERLPAELPEVLLASFSVLLSRLTGQEDTAILAALGAVGGVRPSVLLPVRTFPVWQKTFREYLQQVRETIEASRPHRLYGLSVLSSPFVMGEKKLRCPVFDVRFDFWSSPEEKQSGEPDRLLEYFPEVRDGLKLTLEAVRGRAGISLCLRYQRKDFPAALAEDMAACVAEALRLIAARPEECLGDLEIGKRGHSRAQGVAVDQTEAFQF